MKKTLENRITVIHNGDQNGNGMVFKVSSRSGTDIFGLATRNFYGGNWDLGPTWNYLVMADEPFLVDTGRTGTFESLLGMIENTGFALKNLKTVVLSHGHEDHDGGVAEIVRESGARVMAHPCYEQLIRLAPDKVPEGVNRKFPASCWHCPMPETFVDDNCRLYHQSRNELIVNNVCASDRILGENVRVMYLPGHSPDAIAILIDEEIAIVGDNVLPDISPAPSKQESFKLVKSVFPDDQPEIQQAFGLESYIRTLKSLKQLGETNDEILALPGHRLYYDGRWNFFRLKDRSAEIIEHHIDRCRDIERILGKGSKTVREIMQEHFEPSLLEGMGFYMARNEILSHLELMVDCGDIRTIDEEPITGIGSGNFESHIRNLAPWAQDGPINQFSIPSPLS